MRRVPLLALIVLLAAEVCVIVVIAHVIGVAWTIAALVASTVAGLWLVRIQGGRAWRALLGALDSGVPPGRELGDAALVLAGGALIAFPGFVTDAAGLCAVMPVTRPVVRRVLGAYLGRSSARQAAQAGWAGSPHVDESDPAAGKVIRVEVLDEGETGTGDGDDVRRS